MRVREIPIPLPALETVHEHAARFINQGVVRMMIYGHIIVYFLFLSVYVVRCAWSL